MTSARFSWVDLGELDDALGVQMSGIVECNVNVLGLVACAVERIVLSAPLESQWMSGIAVSPVTSLCRYTSD